MDIVPLVIGVIFVVFNKFVSQKIIESQNSTLGLKYGKKEVQIARYVVVLVGAGFLLVGLNLI